MTLRRRIGNTYVVAEALPDGGWKVQVTDAFQNPVEGEERERAIRIVLVEISSLRRHLWKVELGEE